MLKVRWEAKFKEMVNGYDIPNDWEEKTINQVLVNLKKGKTPKDIKGKYPYFSAKFLRGEENIIGKFGREAGVFVKEDDIVILWDGGNSGEVFKGKSGILASTMCKVEFDDSFEKEFLYVVLKAREDELKDSKSGTDDRHLDKDYFFSFSIQRPSLREQSRIAKVLIWFHELIENKKRQIEVYETAAEAIFKKMFFNFSSLRKGEYDPSSIEDLPDGWEVKPIGKIAKCVSGFSYSSKEKFEDKGNDSYVFINLNNLVEGGGFKPEYSWLKSEKLKDRHYLEECDLIISNVHFGVGGSETERLMAVPALVSFPPGYDKKLGVYSMDLTRIIPNSPKMKYYMYEYLKITREDSASFSTGTSILHLDHTNFKKNKMIICPNDPVLKKFNSLAGPMFEKIRLSQKQIIILEKVRDTLLPLLVFGKLRVEEI